MQARQLGVTPVVLSLPVSLFASLPRPDPDVAPSVSNLASASNPAYTATILGTVPRLMSLLFADVRGFSRLSEAQLLVFAREFLGRVAALVEESRVRPVTRHTWGDGLFFTFDRVGDAGAFALDLAELIDRMDWGGVGLPSDLSIRIGLHCGPVYECFDPISRQPTYCGVHVNHAARIEPITPPGNVYASEAFAALASAEEVRGFVCEYVGRTPLAKDFGLFSTYHVRRGAPEQP
jgi:class 3 adenylate cyclase